MTALTIGKIVGTECSFAVVASLTTLPSRRRKVHRRQRSRDLSAACGTCKHVVARRTIHISLSDVLIMTEVHGVCLGPLGRSRRSAGRVAGAARPDRFILRMTLKTRIMSGGPLGYRQSDPAVGRSVASRTIRLTDVTAVVESSVKTLERRKPLHCTGLRVSMANRTDRAGGILNLSGVTACTRSVFDLAGKAEPGRVIITPMAQQTRQPGV